jgi:hypothetical protein
MKKIPIRNKEFVWRNLDGEVVLLNPNSGKYFGMNEVGCSFWEKVDDKRRLEEIVDLLLEEYNVDRETLEKDISELAASLEKNDIVGLSE